MREQKVGSKKVRKGDRVCVISGNAKGQVGSVAMVMDNRVIIEGVNLCKKHIKKSQQHPEGGRIDVERPIHISNVSPCDQDGKPVKVKTRVGETGERELYYEQNGEQHVWRSVKSSKK